MITKTYAFLKKEGDDYTIIDIKIIPNDISNILKFENHDLAFPCEYSIYQLFMEAQINKESKIFKVRKTFNPSMILMQDLYIIDINKLAKKVQEKEEKNKEQLEEELNELVFEEEKLKILKNYINYIFPRITMFDIINTIEILFLNNKFVSKGYYITDENQEDIFIELIEKDDDDLIEDLEKFIEYKLNFEKFQNYFKKYIKLKNEIEYINYWEFDNLEEALNKLNEIKEKYNPNKIEYNPNKSIELLQKIKQEIKKRIKNEKEQTSTDE